MIRTFFDKGGMPIATIIQHLDHGDNLYIYSTPFTASRIISVMYSFRQVQDSVKLGWQSWVKEKCILICAAVKKIMLVTVS